MNPYNLQHIFYLVGDTIALAIYLFPIMLGRAFANSMVLARFSSIFLLRAWEEDLVPIMLGRSLAISIVMVKWFHLNAGLAFPSFSVDPMVKQILVYDPCVYAFCICLGKP